MANKALTHVWHSGGWLRCTEQVCFACDKAFSIRSLHYHVRTSDNQMVCVGRSCFQRIKQAGAEGYQPAIGGPKLFLRSDSAKEDSK